VAFLSAEGDLLNLTIGYRNATQFRQIMEDTLKTEEKFQNLKKAIQKTPEDAKTNGELAVLYLQRRNIEKGQPLADKALKLDPKNKTGVRPDVYSNLGLYYGMNVTDANATEYFPKAEMYFKKVIVEYPKSKSVESAKYYLGVTYAMQEKYEPALEWLEKAANSKDPEVKVGAAQMLERVKGLAGH
jgi:tetratricopeptide (TPR) repeat protein